MNPQQRQDLARLRELLSDPASDPTEIADCYVRLISEQLLTLARTGYERGGRGVVVVDLRGIDLRNTTGGMAVGYCVLADAEDDWPAGLDEVVTSYDIRREVVVLLFQDHGPLVYVLEEQ